MSKSKCKKQSKFKRTREQEIHFMGNLAKKLKAVLSTEEYDALQGFIQDEIRKSKKEATNQAVEWVWALMFRILRDKFEWGQVRLTRLWDYAKSYSEDIEKGILTLPEIVESLHEEGINLN